MSAASVKPSNLIPYLKRYGYPVEHVVEAYPFADGKVPVLAFASQPHDARSACIAVVSANGDPKAACSGVWRTGAPVVWVCNGSEIEWWKQSVTTPTLVDRFSADATDRFLRDHREDFEPARIYRAKTLGRVDSNQQLSFVDVGLMPLAEHDSGEALSGLMGRVITRIAANIREATGRRSTSDLEPDEERKVYRGAFWLLGAKMLHDKRVENFKNLGIDKENPTSEQIRAVFERVAKHQADPDGLPPTGKGWTAALREAAKSIFGFEHLGAMSTESLAWMWERTLITDEVRSHLAIHSTPSYLADYILWQLAPWIERIPENDRYVFEPACGHAAFLVGALRLLRFLYEGRTGDDWHTYRRNHLRGIEIDPFAVEIARLSLALADIPNHNGWSITQADMYSSNTLEIEAKQAMILLGNPPFRKFDVAEKRKYGRAGFPVRHSKAVEVLDRTVQFLPPGGVFGFVLPLGVLHSKEATEFRQILIRDFEVSEVCMFPDKVFAFAEPEMTVLMGRKLAPTETAKTAVRYRRVEEGAVDQFQKSYETGSNRSLSMSRFIRTSECIMLVPELDDVWTYLSAYPTLTAVADVAKGLEFKGRDLPPGAKPVSLTKRRGDVAGYQNVPDDLRIDGTPLEVWMDLRDGYIRIPGSGVTTNVPQVLLAHARVSRGRWRARAVIDRLGHAVTGRFLTVRPINDGMPLEFLWALLNSPLANCFLSCRGFTRDVLLKDVRRLPVPKLDRSIVARVVAAAKDYLAVPKQQAGLMQPEPDREAIRAALLRMDAEVLALYDLPRDLERQVIDWFQGQTREGVHCSFVGYPHEWSVRRALNLGSAASTDKSIWDKFDEAIGSLPPDAIAALPVDGAAEHDHYLYGTPKNAR